MKHYKSGLVLLLVAAAGCASESPMASASVNHRSSLTVAQINDSNNYPDPSKPDDFAKHYSAGTGERVNIGGGAGQSSGGYFYNYVGPGGKYFGGGYHHF